MTDDNDRREALVDCRRHLCERLNANPLHKETADELGYAISMLDCIIAYEDNGEQEKATEGFGVFLGRYNALLNALNNEHGRLGLYTRAERARFASVKNAEAKAKAEERHERWIAEDQRLADERPHITSKRARADAIRKALQETATADHIARHLSRR